MARVKKRVLSVLAEANKKPLDEWMVHAYETAEAHLNEKSVQREK